MRGEPQAKRRTASWFLAVRGQKTEIDLETALARFYYPAKIGVWCYYIRNSIVVRALMTLFSRKADYALLILSYLDEHPDGGSAREVAVRFGLSKAFVANILKLLCHNTFVVSHRGVKGGYVLQRPAEKIRLTDVMDAMDDPVHLAECNKSDPQNACSLLDICPLRRPVAELHIRIRDVLRSVTLDQLFRPGQAVGATQLGLALGSIVPEHLVAQ
jgi:Rrf2 family transcriptional regulator, cysteine metabolism repressor